MSIFHYRRVTLALLIESPDSRRLVAASIMRVDAGVRWLFFWSHYCRSKGGCHGLHANVPLSSHVDSHRLSCSLVALAAAAAHRAALRHLELARPELGLEARAAEIERIRAETDMNLGGRLKHTRHELKAFFLEAHMVGFF